MNRYPLWLNIIIAVLLLGGFLFALPNFFGESPAVQVSSAKPTLKVDDGVLQRAEDALKAGNVAYDEAFLEPTGIKLRFKDTDTQLRAKEVLQKALGDSYVVALNLLSNSPRWLGRIGAKPMYLGLDLRGGVHFLLQVDMKGAVTKYLDSTAAGIRTTLRGEEEARSSGIGREGNSVVIRFREASNRDKAQQIIERNYPDILFVREERGGEYVLAGALKQDAQKRIQDFAIQQNLTTLRNRVNELGVAEPSCSRPAPTASWSSCPVCRTLPRPRRSSAARRVWKCAWWTKSTRICSRCKVLWLARFLSATSCCMNAKVSRCCSKNKLC